MKILHTSDWHLGQSFYSYDRHDEHAAMLNRIAEIVAEEKPDIFLLSGDVFHVSQPSAAVQSMFSEAILNLRDANPGMTIVMTAGNHDSSSKHDIFRSPWKRLGVYTFGALDAGNLNDHILEIPGKGYIVAVPYVHERNMLEGLWQSLLDEVASRNHANLPVVMMAHTTVAGCDFAGHDSATERAVGGIDSLTLEELGTGYDYLALGHIHRPQFVRGGHKRVRYSGTPIAVSFDEAYPHSVSIVEIEKHGDEPSVREVEIPASRPVVTLPTSGFCSWEDAQKLLRDFPDDNPAYIRVLVEVADYLPANAYDEARNLVKDKACRFCLIQVHRDIKESVEATHMTIEEFREEDPINIARRLAKDTNVDFGEDLEMMFQEIVDKIKAEQRQ